jgi:nucleolar complex protein 3
MEGSKDGRRGRQPFTPGWSDDLSNVEALPIKKGNKIVKVHKQLTGKEKEKVNEEEEDVIIHDDDEDKPEEEEPKENKERPVKAVVLPLHVNDRTPIEYERLQQYIADVCTSITSNPEAAILKKQLSEPDADEFGIKDLFAILQSRDVQELELALLSAALVFKDICPSYRIRSEHDGDTLEDGKQLKKETKKLQDFEVGLLKAYQRFLKLLEELTNEGLGSVKSTITTWNLPQRVGLMALRAACELLRSLSYFNLRTNLLTMVVGRACQRCNEVTDICCDVLEEILRKDIHCDLSFEFVKIMSKVLTATKYDIPERLLRCLQSVKLTVHEDKVKALQMKVKSDRKKRKRNEDGVEAMMLEANMETEKLAKQRFQGNSLQEVALIYFR